MSLNDLSTYGAAFSGLTLLARNEQWASTYGVDAGNTSKFLGLALLVVAYLERTVPRQNGNRSSYWAMMSFCLRELGFGPAGGMVALVNLILGLFHLANAWSGSSKVEKMNGNQTQRMIYGTLLYLFALDSALVAMGYGDAAYGSSNDNATVMTYVIFMMICLNLSHNPPKSTAAGLRTWFQVILFGQCLISIVFMHGLSPMAWFNHHGNKVYQMAVVGALCYYGGNM